MKRKPNRTDDYLGAIFVRGTGSKRLYLLIPRKVSETLSIPRNIATGLADTVEARRQAEGILRQVTHKYHAVVGGHVAGPSVRPVNTMTIRRTFDEFMERHAPQRSHNSQRNYVLAYKAVMAHGDESLPIGFSRNHGNRNVLHIEECLEHLITTRRTGKTTPDGRPALVRPETCEIYARTFLIFAQWAHDEGYLSEMPSRKRLRKLHPHMTGKPVRTWTDSEIAQLLAYCRRDGALHSERRIGNLLRVLARTPLRIHEALEMRLRDVDAQAMTLRVGRKDGRSWEYIPLLSEDIAMIIEIAAESGAKNPDDAILGYSTSSVSRLRRTLISACEKSGVDRGDRLFHEFKKTYITRLVSRIGIDLSLHEVARLSRCGIQVVEKHYLALHSGHVRSKLAVMWSGQESNPERHTD